MRSPQPASGPSGTSNYIFLGAGGNPPVLAGHLRDSVHRVSPGLLVPSFRALSGRLNFTVPRQKFQKDSPSFQQAREPGMGEEISFLET